MRGTLSRGALVVLMFAAAAALAADGPEAKTDWPQWRGPARRANDGAAVHERRPGAWPKELKEVWKVEVGEGYSSPVVAGDTVFQFSRENDEEVLLAIRLSDGRRLWEQRHPTPYEMNTYARPAGKGPKSTPVVADGCVVTLGIAGRLCAYDDG